MVTCRFPKTEGSRGLLVEQRKEHWAELYQDLRTPECGHTGSDAGLRSVSMKTAPSVHQPSVITRLHADTFNEDSPETTSTAEDHICCLQKRRFRMFVLEMMLDEDSLCQLLRQQLQNHLNTVLIAAVCGQLLEHVDNIYCCYSRHEASLSQKYCLKVLKSM